MATRSLEQITRQLAKSDKPAENLLKQQIAALPGQFEGQKAGLQAQQQEAFGNILSGAKRRGLKFSGIPLAEQAKFTSTQFLPALANLENTIAQQRAGLQGSLADITRQRGQLAQQLFQTELDRAAQERASRRAAAAQSSQSNFLGSLLGQLSQGQTLGTSTDQDPTEAQLEQQAIKSASAYAQRINSSIKDEKLRRNILTNLRRRGEEGDFGAQARFNAFAKFMNDAQRFDLDTGALTTDQARIPGSAAGAGLDTRMSGGSLLTTARF